MARYADALGPRRRRRSAPAARRSRSRGSEVRRLGGFIAIVPSEPSARACRSGRRDRRRPRPVPRAAVRGRAWPAAARRACLPARGAADALGLSLRDGGVPLSPDPHGPIGPPPPIRRAPRLPAFRGRDPASWTIDSLCLMGEDTRAGSTCSTATPWPGRATANAASTARSSGPELSISTTRRPVGKPAPAAPDGGDLLRALAPRAASRAARTSGRAVTCRTWKRLEFQRRLAQDAPRQVHQRVAPRAQHVAHTLAGTP
jgi:hypothetical protein